MSSPVSPRRSVSKTLGLATVIGLLALVVILDVSRRKAESEVASLTMRLDQASGGNTANNKAAADEVIAKLRKHMVIVSDSPTVATIVDPAVLQKQNAFYKDAQKGDFVVIDAKDGVAKAILYRASTDVIINVVPVQFTNQSSAATSAESSKAPAAAAHASAAAVASAAASSDGAGPVQANP